MVFDEPDCKSIFEAMDEEIKARQKQGKWPENPPKDARMPFKPSMQKQEDGSKVLEEGKLLWVFKRKEFINRRGEKSLNSAPQVWDGGGLNITKNCPPIGLQSLLKVFYVPFAYNNMSTGVTLQLVGVQIVELKESLGDFTPGAVDGAYRAPEEMQPGKSLAEMFSGEAFESDD